MWVSSIDFLSLKNFTHKKDINVLHQKIKRAKDRQKQYIKMDNDYFTFTYSKGIGRGGKVLRIWNEPFRTEAEAQAFMQSYTQEQVAYLSNTDSNKTQSSALAFIESSHATTLEPISQTNLTTPNEIGTLTQSNKEDKALISSESIHLGEAESHTDNNAGNDRSDDVISALRDSNAFAKSTQKQQLLTLEKKSIIKEWEVYKARGVNVKDFIALTNASSEYSITLSENKLYAWQRVYKNEGLDGLLDERGSNRAQSSKIKELGIEELTNKLILASRGRVNISSLHRMLHIHLDSVGKADLADFLAKRSEAISYCVLERYVKAYLKAHPIESKLIYRGEDATVGLYRYEINHRHRLYNQLSFCLAYCISFVA